MAVWRRVSQRSYAVDFGADYVPAYIPENPHRVALYIQHHAALLTLIGVIFSDTIASPLIVRPGETLIIDNHCPQGVVSLISASGGWVTVIEVSEGG